MRLRNYVSEEVRYPILRLMANSTYFLNKPVRFLKKDIDFGDTATAQDHFYLDIYAEFLEDASDYHNKLVKIRMTEKFLNKPVVNVGDNIVQRDEEETFEIGGGDESEEDGSDSKASLSPQRVQHPVKKDESVALSERKGETVEVESLKGKGNSPSGDSPSDIGRLNNQTISNEISKHKAIEKETSEDQKSNGGTIEKVDEAKMEEAGTLEAIKKNTTDSETDGTQAQGTEDDKGSGEEDEDDADEDIENYLEKLEKNLI